MMVCIAFRKPEGLVLVHVQFLSALIHSRHIWGRQEEDSPTSSHATISTLAAFGTAAKKTPAYCENVAYLMPQLHNEHSF